MDRLCVRVLEADLGIPGIRAFSTLRSGGPDYSPYDGLNLADHVGDRADRVAANRRLLEEVLLAGQHPLWLRQVHGTGVVAGHVVSGSEIPEADAVWTHQPGLACAVLTADCLPILFSTVDGSAVAAVHAGWRGLAAGVVEAALAAMPCSAGGVHAWMGPAIGACCYEVGADVCDVFVKNMGPAALDCFVPSSASGKYQADLYGLAALRLKRAGVNWLAGGHQCTACNPTEYFSHRRDGQTGRMASVITILPT